MEDNSVRLGVPEKAVEKTTFSVRLEFGSPCIVVDIEGRTRRPIIDIVSNISIFQPGISSNDVKVTS